MPAPIVRILKSRSMLSILTSMHLPPFLSVCDIRSILKVVVGGYKRGLALLCKYEIQPKHEDLLRSLPNDFLGPRGPLVEPSMFRPVPSATIFPEFIDEL